MTTSLGSTGIDGRGVTGMRIVADRERCEGHGLCADTAPEVYELDDDAIDLCP